MRVWWEEALDQWEVKKRCRGCSWKEQGRCREKETWRRKEGTRKEGVLMKTERENEGWIWGEEVIKRVGRDRKEVTGRGTKARVISDEAKRRVIYLAA